MKRVFALFATVTICLLILTLGVGATEVDETVDETVTETETEAVDVTEEVKAALIILAESETRSEAVEKLMELKPTADVADVIDLVGGFESMSELWDCRECVMYGLSEGLQYGLEEEWIEWYLDTYFTDLPETCEYWEEETVDPGEVGEMIDTIIGGVKDGALSMKDAILMVSEIAGMSKAEAEDLINKAISVGDSYLQDTTWWEGAKEKVMENLEFFTVCLIVFVDVLAIIAGAAILVIKIKRPINNIDYGTAQVAKDSTENKNAISQTLEILKADITSALNIGETARTEMLDREEKHVVLEEQLLKALQENAELKRGMLNTQAFILQILKLIYSRTDLTLADKSVLDLWTATSEVILGEQMSEEDALKLEEMKTILKGEKSDA